LLKRVKRIIAGALCHPYVGASIAMVYQNHIRTTRGHRIYVDNHHVTPSVKAQIFWGLYERAEVQFVRQYLYPQYDVIELGSNIGVVATHIRNRIHYQQRLICVEASPDALPLLSKNAINLQSLGPVEILHAAISSSHATSVPFTIAADRVASQLAHCVSSDTPHTMVPSITLSQILHNYGIGDFVLVCDIEGAEKHILLDDPDSLRRCKQIIIELHTSEHQNQRISLNELCQRIIDITSLHLQRRHGPVCVFSTDGD
jgi:FkbM family methyltransferase